MDTDSDITTVQVAGQAVQADGGPREAGGGT